MDMPRYTNSFFDGCFDTMRELNQRNEIEFCYNVDGQLVSTDKTSDRSYRKLGIEPSALNKCSKGFYWKGTDKPYFIG
jgi:hypothetical protein